ncbi:MAG: bifunctional alpha,alpha-trehalose-phosphate synthase (UDP-forming)/trehalose-phosphatase, partial [Myxococcales bacterium]
FSNRVLWPLFHYLLDRVPPDARDWDMYRKVNERFADLVAAHYRPGDMIWVHDYQLALVPGMLRQRLPDARIGFFLHIPFPASDVFRILPWRDAVLEGLLGADLIGFHTLEYVRNFGSSLLRCLGVPVDVDRVRHEGREIQLGAFPMGIDAQSFEAHAGTEEVLEELVKLRSQARGQFLLLGIDRLDYTKGILRRLLAVERLLEKEPWLRGKLRLIQVAVPSRTKVDAYEQFRQQVDELVGRINGAYGTFDSVPIHYLYRSFSERQLTAMYRAADVMLVTPLRDGMNLVAKEFVAARTDESGVLLLSEFAGAACELGEAVLVNPYDVDGMASAIKQALVMPEEEKRVRMRALRRRVKEFDVHLWADSFVDALARIEQKKEQRLTGAAELEALVAKVATAERLLLLVEYDGILVPFNTVPELAGTEPGLLELLRKVARRPGTAVHVISGRSQQFLSKWLGAPEVGLHAEHGIWSRPPGGEWSREFDGPLDWMERVRHVLQQFSARTPGSRIEEKTASVSWHYRLADPEFGARQARELVLHLSQTFSNVPVEVVSGDRIVEVRPHGVARARVVAKLVEQAGPDAMVVALGNNRSGDDLFAALPPHGVAIHVGRAPSHAAYRIADPAATRRMLEAIASLPPAAQRSA